MRSPCRCSFLCDLRSSDKRPRKELRCVWLGEEDGRIWCMRHVTLFSLSLFSLSLLSLSLSFLSLSLSLSLSLCLSNHSQVAAWHICVFPLGLIHFANLTICCFCCLHVLLRGREKMGCGSGNSSSTSHKTRKAPFRLQTHGLSCVKCNSWNDTTYLLQRTTCIYLRVIPYLGPGPGRYLGRDRFQGPRLLRLELLGHLP